jgi:hypothetical protein
VAERGVRQLDVDLLERVARFADQQHVGAGRHQRPIDTDLVGQAILDGVAAQLLARRTPADQNARKPAGH